MIVIEIAGEDADGGQVGGGGGGDDAGDVGGEPHLIPVICEKVLWWEVPCQHYYHHSLPACQSGVVTQLLSHTQLRVLLSLHLTLISLSHTQS